MFCLEACKVTQEMSLLPRVCNVISKHSFTFIVARHASNARNDRNELMTNLKKFEKSSLSFNKKERSVSSVEAWTARRSQLDRLGTPFKQRLKPTEAHDPEEHGFLHGDSRKTRKGKSTSEKSDQQFYVMKIKSLYKMGKYAEAIDVLEVQMLKTDRVQPKNDVFNALVTMLGHIGNTEKAFQLFDQMEKLGLVPTLGIFTSLFNACANSPCKVNGLQRAVKLRQLVQEKGLKLDSRVYNSMVKAFAMCGDFVTAFAVFDEMVAANLKPDDYTFGAFLSGAVLDKASGFRLAIEVWHRMRKQGVVPGSRNYTLFLKTVHECGLDPVSTEIANSTAKETLDDNQSREIDLQLTGNSTTNERQRVDVLDPRTNIDDKIFGVRGLKSAENRLNLLGGVDGILNEMARDGVKPDVFIFTILLKCIPSNRDAEKQLLATMAGCQVTPHRIFYNTLIRNRAVRLDDSGAQQVEDLMREAGITPLVDTYSFLAMTCRQRNDAVQLFKNMEKARIRPNLILFKSLLKVAYLNFPYKTFICDKMKQFGVHPDRAFIAQVEESIKRTQVVLSYQESKLEVEKHPYAESLGKSFSYFRSYFKLWRQQMPVVEE